MERNIGTIERIFRLVLGLVILGLYAALPGGWRYLALLGLIPLGTAITGFCPAYRLFGIRRGGAGPHPV